MDWVDDGIGALVGSEGRGGEMEMEMEMAMEM